MNEQLVARHEYTKTRLSGQQFRVTTYNLLADLYCDSDYSRKTLFPYCNKMYLDIDYRKQLFIKELIHYNSDIICLQEVDAKIFEYDLKMVFECGMQTYAGTFKPKGTTSEGLATFYDTQRFTLIHSYGITIGEQIPTFPAFADIWREIENNKKLSDRICERSTAVQVTVLKSVDNGNYLLVANTHLYFHPDADHIRLLQIGLAMKYVQYVYEKTTKEVKEPNISIIFSGDFNSVPECGIYKLMTEQLVNSDFIDFQSSKCYIIFPFH